jgi:DNA-binding response OmpR family regulator
MADETNILTVPDLVEELVGKRLALCNFEKADAEKIEAVLDDAGAFCRNIPGDPAKAPAMSRSFDGVLVYIDAGSELDLKSLAATGKPILVVGSHAILATRVKSIRTYAVDCLGYPCSSEELLLRTCCLTGVPAPGRRPEAGPPVVLIADDDPSIRAVVRATLGSKLVECHVAEEGVAALRIAREIRPSVLVLDVNMPLMDGFEVLAAIRNEGATASIRVLMLTGCEQENDIVRAFGLGADDYLVKPFNPMELAVRVRRLLGVAR